MTTAEIQVQNGFKMTALGELPEEWCVEKLGSIIKKTKQKDPKKTPDWQFKYIDVSGVDRDTLSISDYKSYLGNDAPSRAKKIVYTGDVIFATVRPTLKRVALVKDLFNEQICSTAFCVLRADENKAIPLHLYYATSRDSFIGELGKIQRGASYPAVTDTDVKNQKIPLPPLPEQKKIAAVLLAVQEAKEKTEAVINATKEFKKSMMKHLFTYGAVPLEDAEKVPLKETEIGMIPEKWEVVKVSDIAKIVSGGTPSRKKPDFWNGNIPWVKTGEVNYSTINATEECITLKGLEGSSARMIPSGTLLMAMYGQGITRGRVGILGIDASINQACAAFSLNEKANTGFLFHYLVYSYERVRNLGHGAHQKNLSAMMIKAIVIPLPSLDEQSAIAGRLNTVDYKLKAEQDKLSALDALFKSLLHNLMTGKVRVKDLEIPV